LGRLVFHNVVSDALVENGVPAVVISSQVGGDFVHHVVKVTVTGDDRAWAFSIWIIFSVHPTPPTSRSYIRVGALFHVPTRAVMQIRVWCGQRYHHKPW